MAATDLPEPGQRALDVLILDDQMPMLRAANVAAAHDQGTHVLGLWDETAGRGRDFLIEMGVDDALPASTAPVELLAAVLRVGPVNAGTGPFDDAPVGPGASAPYASAAGGWSRAPQPARRATITGFQKVSGGAGGTETLVAVAERLEGRARRVLVIEAGGATLAHRLRRAPEYGLTWSLDRVASGHRALPNGLSPGREDGTRPLGRFDVICGTTAPAGPPPVNPIHLGQLLDEASSEYDHILVETGPLSAPPAVAGGDRFAAARIVLARADQVVVMAAPDPSATIKLVDWRSVVHDLNVSVRCIAVFGRFAGRRFERAALIDAVERNTGAAGFSAFRFLPEDSKVGRCRWNGELVKMGRWAHAVDGLAAELGRVSSTKPAPTQTAAARRGTARGVRRQQTGSTHTRGKR